ncbi:hypothetical protein FOA52_013655 [Chlamydomonas sp. UWO 241]|nr:hypothetical protein FOA52_013655 [Chlamydomonas sp. UWO 241]
MATSSMRRHASRQQGVVASSNAEGPAPIVYQGAFGPFSIGPDDETEVLLYRVGINVAAAAAVSTSLVAFLPEGNGLRDALIPSLDAIAIAGTVGLGLALYQIHIYLAPIKRTLQALWLAGALGVVGIVVMQDPPAALFVAEHPAAVWLVGPMFAALTGVAFKEGMCYGKAEAAALFGATPLLLLGHLTGLVPADGERVLLALFCTVFAVFAGRKWTQAVKDDVGDKSVFAFLAMAPEEQAVAQAAREARERGD